jgi:hypothetical protein
MPPRRIDPARVNGALHVEHCDIPADLTLTEWRRECRAAAAAEAARVAHDGRATRRRPLSGLRRALRLG